MDAASRVDFAKFYAVGAARTAFRRFAVFIGQSARIERAADGEKSYALFVLVAAPLLLAGLFSAL